MLRRLPVLVLAGALAAASAADLGAPPGTPDNRNIPTPPEWKEVESPPPPALRTTGLIPIDVRGTTLRFAVDPKSISVGPDGVVRYVVVATSSSGTVNAIYEGLRCSSGEVKVYARHNPDSGWVAAQGSEWGPVFQSAATRHSLVIARSGACQESAPNGSARQIAQDLASPIDRRYQRGGVNQ